MVTTKQEMREIISLIAGTYNLNLDQSRRADMLKAWGYYLREFDYDLIVSTVTTYSYTNQYPPKPTDVLARIVLPDAPTPDEAWQQASTYSTDIQRGVMPSPIHPVALQALSSDPTVAGSEWAYKQAYKKQTETILATAHHTANTSPATHTPDETPTDADTSTPHQP